MLTTIWKSISTELRNISDVFGVKCKGGYGSGREAVFYYNSVVAILRVRIFQLLLQL